MIKTVYLSEKYSYHSSNGGIFEEKIRKAFPGLNIIFDTDRSGYEPVAEMSDYYQMLRDKGRVPDDEQRKSIAQDILDSREHAIAYNKLYKTVSETAHQIYCDVFRQINYENEF
jgi:Ca2+-binding EF-hand superfamily protein